MSNMKVGLVLGAALSGTWNATFGAAGRSLQGLGRSVRDLEARQAALSAKWDSLRGRMAGAAGLGLIFQAPIRAAMDFESAMADVRKTVDFETPEGFDQLGRVIREMARDIPISQAGLAEIAAAGGQLGLSAGDLPEFIGTAAEMATAFDMLPGRAGEAMAKLSNVFNIPISEMDKLGDAINHLSDNSAAKAGDIVDALQRIGGTAQQFGLSETQAAALASSFLALGKDSSTAATATNALLMKLATADSQGKKFNQALAKMGLSAEELKEKIGEDAQGALVEFLEAMNDLPEADRLDAALGIGGLEFGDDLALLASNTELVKKQLGLVADESQYAGSMTREFQNRIGTTAAQMGLLKNKVGELAINIGSVLLPPLNAVIDLLGRGVVRLTEFAEAHPELTRAIGGAVGALIGLKVASIAASAGWLSLQSTALGLARAMVFLTGPVGLAVAALAAGAALVIRYWEPIKAFFEGLGKGIKAAFEEAGLGEVWEGLSRGAEMVSNALQSVWEWLTSLLEPLGFSEDALNDWRSAGEGAGRAVGQALVWAWNEIKSVWDGAKDFFEAIWPDIESAAGAVWDSIKDNASWAWDGIKNIWNGAKDFFGEVWAGIESAAPGVWEGIKDAAVKTWNRIEEIWEGAKVVLGDIWSGLEKVGAAVWPEIRDAALWAWDRIKEVWSGATEWFDGLWGEITAGAPAAWEEVKNIAQGVFDRLLEIGSGFKETFSGTFERVEEIMGPALQSLSEAAGKIFKAFEPLIQAVKDLWAPSEDTEGWKEFGRIMGLVASDGVELVAKAAATLAEALAWGLTKASELINALTTGDWSFAGEALEKAFKMADDAIKAVEETVGAVLTWIEKQITKMMEVLEEIFTTIEEVIESVKKTIGDALKWIEEKTAPLFKKIEELAEKASSLPGVGRLFGDDEEDEKKKKKDKKEEKKAPPKPVPEPVAPVPPKAPVNLTMDGMDEVRKDLAALNRNLSKMESAWPETAEAADSALDKIRALMGAAEMELHLAGGKLMTGLASGIRAGSDEPAFEAGKALDQVLVRLAGIEKRFGTAGEKMMSALAEGIRKNAAAPAEATREALDKVEPLLPHSDAERGPLSTLTASGRSILATLGAGMRAEAPAFSKEMEAALARAERVAAGVPAAGASGGAATAGMAGYTVTVNIDAPGGDARDIAAEVQRVLDERAWEKDAARRGALYDDV